MTNGWNNLTISCVGGEQLETMPYGPDKSSTATAAADLTVSTVSSSQGPPEFWEIGALDSKLGRPTLPRFSLITDEIEWRYGN